MSTRHRLTNRAEERAAHGPIRKTRKTRRLAAAILALAAVAGGTATASAADQAAAAAAEDPAGDVEPPAGRVDVGAPRVALDAVATELAALVRRNGSLEAALTEVRLAQSTFGSMTGGAEATHLSASVDALVAAQRALATAAADGSVGDLPARLAAVARRIAVGLVEIAARADVDRGTVAQARVELARGDKLAAAGNHAGATAAFGKGVKVGGNALTFDIARFEQNIRGFFDTQTTGYSYAIVRQGNLYTAKGFGKARGAFTQSPDGEMNIASMTKTITAAAVLKLMEKNKLDLDESVASFLPDEWNLHPSIQDLTYRDLLTQRSGLNGNVNPGTKLDAMRAAFEKGINPADKKVFTYQNANLAIFRVIIPAMLGVDIYGDPDTAPDVLASRTYVEYLQDHIFEDHPLGRRPDCKKTEDPQFLGIVTSRAFAFPDDGSGGTDPGDWTLSCGGGGLYMSAKGVARFLSRLHHTNEILSPLWREWMDSGFLGYNDPINGYSWNNGAFGVYRSHGGDLNYGNRGVDTCATAFPIGVEATVLINSRLGAYPYQCDALSRAFDAAWVKK